MITLLVMVIVFVNSLVTGWLIRFLCSNRWLLAAKFLEVVVPLLSAWQLMNWWLEVEWLQLLHDFFCVRELALSLCDFLSCDLLPLASFTIPIVNWDALIACSLRYTLFLLLWWTVARALRFLLYFPLSPRRFAKSWISRDKLKDSARFLSSPSHTI